MSQDYVLRFANNIIEHLGVKLYQNKPTNVVAEYVANAWDAGAENVDVLIESVNARDPKIIVITDDGEGMTKEILLKRFLVIGVNRRHVSKDAKVAKGRVPMGRKGIGKLAGFGISNLVDVITCSKESDSLVFHWLRFDLDEILKRSQENTNVSYEPEVVGEGKLSEFDCIAQKSGIDSNLLSKFRGNLDKCLTGTCVVLRNVKLAANYSLSRLASGIAERFALNLINESMKVSVNGKDLSVASQQVLLKDFSIGSPDNLKEDTLNVNGIVRSVKYWIGFANLSNRDNHWTLDDAGFAVYAHNKIVQGRPFYFGIKGKEIWSRYMVGYVYADWLDDFEEDLVSTDRDSINWESPQATALYDWGTKMVKDSLSQYLDYRKKDASKAVEQDTKSTAVFQTMSAPEYDALKGLLCEIYPHLSDLDQKKKACNVIAEAWIRKPMQVTLKKLWNGIGGSDMSAKHISLYLSFVDQLRENQTGQLLDLGVKAAMRLHAVRQMGKIIENGATETHLQRLIEDFPWLLKPQWECLTANQQIATVLKKLLPDSEMKAFDESKKRPDFVFLNDSNKNNIVVIELKGAEFDKTLMPKEFMQLGHYIDLLCSKYPNSDVKGVLIGHDISGVPEKLRAGRNNIRLVNWQEVLNEAEVANIDILQTILLPQVNSKDLRFDIIGKYVGSEELDKLLAALREKGLLEVKDYDGDQPIRKSDFS